jgi:hypothetical protein
LSEGDPVNTRNPARQMTLVGKSCPDCNFSEARLPVPYKLDRVLQSQMHDVAVRRHADGSGKHAYKVERAAPRDSRKRGHFDRFVEVSNDIILEAIKELPAERTSRSGSKSRWAWSRRACAGYVPVGRYRWADAIRLRHAKFTTDTRSR